MRTRIRQWITAVLGPASLLAGCAHVQLSEPAFSIDVRKGDEADIIQVLATNVSDEARCLRSELLRNPNTQSAHIDGRLNGTRLPDPPDGYLLPQLVGVETLEPGESVTFKLNLAWQGWDLPQQSSGDRLEVKVAVDSWDCSTETGQQRSFSPWTRLVE